MGKVITVWGSPGSGKSMFCCILAKALTRDKRKAIIINADMNVPMLPVWLPEQIIQTNTSIGQVLSSVEIDTSLVASHVTVPVSYTHLPKYFEHYRNRQTNIDIRVVGSPQEMPRIKPRTILYRNFDQEFERLMSRKSAERKMCIRDRYCRCEDRFAGTKTRYCFGERKTCRTADRYQTTQDWDY